MIENKTSQYLNFARLTLLMITLEGIPAFYFLLRQPSKTTNEFLFGYSLSRLTFAGIAFLCLALVAWPTLRSWQDAHWLVYKLKQLDSWLSVKNRLQAAFVLLAYVSLAAFLLLIFMLTPISTDMDTARAVFAHADGLYVWGLLTCVETLIWLTFRYQSTIRQRGFFVHDDLLRQCLLYLLLTLTIFHWWVLIFREAIFTGIKGWYWQFHLKSFHPRDVLFLLMTGMVMALVIHLVKRTRYEYSNLALLIVLGYLLQVGFGFIEGQGFESLRLKYTDSSYKYFALQASDRPPLLYAMIHYEEKYGHAFSLKTKPPGALLTYLVSQRLAHLFSPEDTFEGRFLRLTTLATYVFPLLATLVVLPLYLLSRGLLKEQDRYLPALLYLVCPNVLLIPLLLDQFLYPLLFTLGILFIIFAIQAQSFCFALVVGIYIFIAAFFSFSLLPLALLAFLLVILNGWMQHGELPFARNLLLAAGIAAGIVISYFLFRLLLNYDFFLRYSNALALHREHKHFSVNLLDFLKALFINNIEFTCWTGVPVILLMFTQCLNSAVSFLKRKTTNLDWLVVAFALTYLATNLLGQTRSEVGRLWLFMVPLASLFAIQPARQLLNNKNRGLFLVVILQMVTVFLTYKFQDFY